MMMVAQKKLIQLNNQTLCSRNLPTVFSLHTFYIKWCFHAGLVGLSGSCYQEHEQRCDELRVSNNKRNGKNKVGRKTKG